ncbi:hypothetical protein KKB55_08735 [Myxococcota bacterium]|nr:hypothetical protein [Myxococcota bacterium]MBU1897827.1 hypothetical protein [Myxococcota bacterium]
MSAAIALDARHIVLDLHGVLQQLDPTAWRDEMQEALKQRLEAIEAQLRELLDHCAGDEQLAAFRERFYDLVKVIKAAPHPNLQSHEIRAQWMSFRGKLQPAYTAVASALRGHAVHVPAVRATNYRRSLFHFLAGMGTLAIILGLPKLAHPWIAGTAMLYAWSMEGLRRRYPELNRRLMNFYGPMAHPHEYTRVNSATWYCTALAIISLTPGVLISALGVVVLSVSDPIAGIVGRRWGKHRFANGRSWEGTAAFFGSALLVSLLLLALFADLRLSFSLLVAIVGAAVGAFVELNSQRVDDNLSIPVSVSLAVLPLFLLL